MNDANNAIGKAKATADKEGRTRGEKMRKMLAKTRESDCGGDEVRPAGSSRVWGYGGHVGGCVCGAAGDDGAHVGSYPWW